MAGLPASCLLTPSPAPAPSGLCREQYETSPGDQTSYSKGTSNDLPEVIQEVVSSSYK